MRRFYFYINIPCPPHLDNPMSCCITIHHKCILFNIFFVLCTKINIIQKNMHKFTLAIYSVLLYIVLRTSNVKFEKSQEGMENIMKEKVVLAYSGGLDTTVIIPWLKENFDYEVTCVCGNCGQADELDGLEERALSSGASKLYIEDLTDEFCDDFIVPCVQAHAV